MAAPQIPTSLDERRDVFRDLLGAFLFCLILFVLQEWFVNHTFVGRTFENSTYELLERRLSETLRQADDVPLTVVDISPLEPTSIEPGLGGGRSTSPRELLSLLDAVATAEPAAIAIDVDLSPLGSVDVSPGVLELMKGAERIHREQGIPVVLGIHRTEGSAPDYWLGFPRYSHLAAGMTVPRPEQGQVVRTMEKVIVPMRDGKPDPSLKITSISAALVPPGHQAEAGVWIRVLNDVGLVKNSEVKELPGLSADEFVIDFSPAKTLYENRVVAKNAADLSRQQHRFAGRIVLIGDGDPDKAEPPDTYVIPGDPIGRVIPGVYVHACAAYTLSRAPLFQFTTLGRFAADIVLFLLAFGPLAIWRLRRSPGEELVRSRELLLTAISVVLVILFAHTLVRTTRILWTDFVTVIVATIFHVATGTLSTQLGKLALDAANPLVGVLRRGSR